MIREQIILGSLLGDGCIYKNDRWLRYVECHCLKQKDYLLWKNSILNFRFYEYKNRVMVCKQKNKLDNNLKLYHNLFYGNGRKNITQKILHKLKPLGLAVWYMDDGTYNYSNKSIKICSQSFDLEGHRIIKEWLNNNFSIHSIIKPVKSPIGTKNYALFLTSKGSKRFIELILPYVHNSLKYKIGQDLDKINHWKNKRKRYMQVFYYNHRIRLTKEAREKYQQNKGKRMKRYYDNKEFYLKQSRERYKNNKIKILSQIKKYYWENKEQILKRQRNYYQINKNKISKRHREYYQKHHRLEKKDEYELGFLRK